MRTIKFRAWNTDYVNNPVMEFFMLKDTNKIEYLHDKHVMQFTGLHDKNGVEIYEGDVLDTHAQYDDVYIRKVVWKDCGLQFEPNTGYTLCKNNENHFEVIGNIYEGIRNES